MSKEHRIVAVRAIVAAGVVAALALVWLWPAGPTYEGKSVAQWFKLFRTASLAEREDAHDAFKALGDQAAPHLLSVIVSSGRPSLLKSYGMLWSKLPLLLKRALPRVSTEDTDYRAAWELLRTVRPSARVLMPRLKPWLASPEHSRYLLAVDLLGTVGDGGSEGVPFLVQALQSTNRYHRVFAVQSLQQLGTEARAAVPALIGALDDPATRTRAIRTLRNIGPEAKAAVPKLERLLDSTNRYEALAVASALHKINPEGNGLGLLIEAARDPRLSLAAIDQLSELGPAAAPAVDLVLEALRTEERKGRAGVPEWMSIAWNLRRISPTNRAAIAILLQRLENAQGLDRLNIGTELVRFDPSESHGLEVLAETLRSDPEANNRDFAAYVLRQAGPGARAAVPALKAALTDEDEGFRKAAASALRQIEPADAK